jgi:hypothetical protein
LLKDLEDGSEESYERYDQCYEPEDILIDVAKLCHGGEAGRLRGYCRLILATEWLSDIKVKIEEFILRIEARKTENERALRFCKETTRTFLFCSFRNAAFSPQGSALLVHR